MGNIKNMVNIIVGMMLRRKMRNIIMWNTQTKKEICQISPQEVQTFTIKNIRNKSDIKISSDIKTRADIETRADTSPITMNAITMLKIIINNNTKE